MTSTITYKASESELVRQGEYYSDFFDSCYIKLSDDSEKMYDEEINISGVQLGKISLIFKAAGDYIIPSEMRKYRVAIVVKDKGSRVLKIIKSIALNKGHTENDTLIPLTSRLPKNFSIGKLAVQLTLRKKRQYYIYAKKSFNLIVPERTLNFPTQWITPEEFESNLKLPGNTPYYLQWLSTNLDSPLNESVCLVMNNRFERAFNFIEVSKEQELFRLQMSAKILAEIFTSILNQVDFDGPENDSLNCRAVTDVLGIIRQRTEVEVEDVINEYRKGNVYGNAFVSSLALVVVRLHIALEKKQ